MEARLANGHDVCAIACALLPDGVMVEAAPDLSAVPATKKVLLDGSHDGLIFEAALQHDGACPMCWSGTIPVAGRMAEVKSSTKANDYHLGDLATQVWVALSAGVLVGLATIRHIDSGFVLEREGALDSLLADTDLMTEAEPIIASRGEVVAAARGTLAGADLTNPHAAHCDAPFPWVFAGYYHAAPPPGPKSPVKVPTHGALAHQPRPTSFVPPINYRPRHCQWIYR